MVTAHSTTSTNAKLSPFLNFFPESAMENNTEESPDFHFPPPPTPPTQQQFFPNFTSSSPETSSYRQNPRKKRTKMIKINNNSSSIMATSTSTSVLKPKYGKKPDPGAPKITRPCTECGKKFWSWKALFGHMRCHPERQWRGINPPPNFRRPLSPTAVRQSSSSRLVEVVMTEEDHEIAMCLLMLANGGDTALFHSPQCGGGGGTSDSRNVVVESETFVRDVEMMGGCGGSILLEGDQEGPSSSGTTTGNCRFECSSCKKVFGSHQALGGHRASHKNVKGCFAITRNDGEDEDRNGSHGEYRDGGEGEVRENLDEKMLMVLGQHRCSICLRVFSSGQALGGHKRCHWEKGEDTTSSLAQGFDCFATPREVCGLDLNLPAPLEDNSSSSYSSGLTLDLKLGI